MKLYGIQIFRNDLVVWAFECVVFNYKVSGFNYRVTSHRVKIFSGWWTCLIITFTSLNASLIRFFSLLSNDFVLQYSMLLRFLTAKWTVLNLCEQNRCIGKQNVDSFSMESLYKRHYWNPCFLNRDTKHWMCCKVYPLLQLFHIVLLFVSFHFLEGHWGRE